MRRLSLVLLVLVAPACYDGHARRPVRSDEACAVCHLDDYNAATNPVHVGSMPTTCGDCHLTTAWRPAGAHPEAAFPIKTGPHEPFDCADCHDASLGSNIDGANTNCVGCHTGTHNRSQVDGQHQDVGGYVWSDTNPHFCLSCHPDGRR